MVRLGGLGLSLLVSACAGNVLDLGHDVEARYATKETIAAEADAGAGIPTLIAARQAGVHTLVLDDTRIYWSTMAGHPEVERDVVRSCAKSDCAGTVVTYATFQDVADRLAVNRTHLFWTGRSTYRGGSIVACPIAGCEGSPRVVVEGVSSSSFAVDDTHLYSLSPDATLVKCPVDGCVGAATVVGLLPYRPVEVPTPLVLDETHIYWIGIKDPPNLSGSIMVAPKDGSRAPRALVENVNRPESLAIDARNVYFTERDAAGAIKSCPLTGCEGEPTVLASGQPYLEGLAVDGQQAYWLTAFRDWRSPLSTYDHGTIPGEVVQCGMLGCVTNVAVLVGNQVRPAAIAVDATHVYWASNGQGDWQSMYSEGLVQRIRRRP
jgi:hypothetical protein